MNRDEDLKRIIDDRQLTESGRTEGIADLCRQARDDRDDARFRPLGDNHHNALACPYCNPSRFDPEKDRARAEAAERALAELRAAARRVVDRWFEERFSQDAFSRVIVEMSDIMNGLSAPTPLVLSAEKAWGLWAVEHLQGQPCSCREAFLAGWEARNAV